MAMKPSKKGRNPGVVDNWLDNIELYRKNVAYDETCLFRAVSEQLFECQIFHERVRRECIEYGRTHYKEFKDLIKQKKDWNKHLQMLEKHMVICGNLEIKLISHKYNRDVLIFHANKQQIYDVTKRGLTTTPLMLCLMDEDHYDAVYKKQYIETAGFCQSLVYKILYEEVFKIPKVDAIVKAMLYEKTQVISQSELEEKNMTIDGPSLEDLDNAVIAPFPFKVAKALDPSIYRNIEYDSWGEVRRELRLGDWYYGDDKLKMGTRCLLTDQRTNEVHDCYIQEILKNEDKCVVYLTKIAEKRIVNYSDLSPESDAKPWPLPYRFSKNLVIANTTQLAPIEKIKCLRKKNKEKRQNKTDVKNSSSVDSEALDNIRAYVGVPLQMQPNNKNNEDPKVETSGEKTALTLPQSEGLLTPATPEINHYPQRYQWEQIQWPLSQTQYIAPDSSYYPQTADPFVWPQGSTTQYYDYKPQPMVTSAPVTPNALPYASDANYSYYYNYTMDQYPLTPNSSSSSPPAQAMKTLDNCEGNCETSQTMAPSETGVVGAQNMEAAAKVNVTFIPQPLQPMEMYHPIVPVPAGTPIIYTSIPPEADMMVPTSPVGVYTPTTPIEVQYLPPSGYIYPAGIASTIPMYTQTNFHYNSQGFIFPQTSPQTN